MQDAMRNAVRTSGLLLTLALAAGLVPDAVRGQEERFPGVELGLVYENAYAPALAVKPMDGRFGGAAAATQVEAILARDLRYSNRFSILDSIPSSLVGGEGIDYTLWDRLGATWLVSGTVEGAGDGSYIAFLRLHDVVYGQIQEEERFTLPNPDSPGFRMAVHRMSDRVVEWALGEQGMAASRIVFPMNRDGTQDLWMIDSDGENLRRITDFGDLATSPTWAPEGDRIAFLSYHEGPMRIYEMQLGSGDVRGLSIPREGNFITPAYHPDGDVVAFSVLGAQNRSGLFTWNVARDCCLSNLTEGRHYDLSPTYSPDGRRVAFNSNRLGDQVPQIYVMPAGGGTPDLLSPYNYGEQGYYTSPDWSPVGDLVAFHGKVGRYGPYQILVARMGEGGRLLQLTSEGNNEDPSWAPDGRHLVFVGERRRGKGLFVVDSATGEIRTLVSGMDVGTPAWSPRLAGN
jgi:TolB protein